MQIRKEIVTSGLENKMPKEILNYTFTFFNQKDLGTCALVSKNFNQLSREAIEDLKMKYAKNIYYTVSFR